MIVNMTQKSNMNTEAKSRKKGGKQQCPPWDGIYVFKKTKTKNFALQPLF